MAYKDIILGPLYLALFYAIAFAMRDRVTNVYTRPFFMTALTLKFVGAIAMGLIFDFYYGGGDTFNYYHDVSIFYNTLVNSFPVGLRLWMENGHYDPQTLPYAVQLKWATTSSELFLTRMSTIIALFCFNTYIVIAFVFAIFSFSGAWAMYITFIKIQPQLYKQMAYAAFFIPSVFFWGSGFMKDSICMGSLGWVFYAFYSIAIEKKRILRSVILGVVCAYLIIVLKAYILLSFMPPALLWIFIENNNRIKNPTLRFLLKPLFLALGAAAGYLGATNLTAGDQEYDINKIAAQTQTTQSYLYRRSMSKKGSTYDIGKLDGTVSGIVKIAPQAIAVTLFRPFLWEVSNIIMLLSALEAMYFTYMTILLIWRAGLFRSLRLIAATPIISFCIIFTLVFSVGVGISSANFGTLVRYKIPLMPFYLAALFIMAYLIQKPKRVVAIPNRMRRAA